MSAQPKLWIDVGADVKGAVRGLNTLTKQVNSFGRQAAAVRNIAIAVTGTIAVKRAVSGLHELAKAAADEQMQQARLQRAIANTGKAVDTGLAASLEGWIQTQSRATGFVDDELREALTHLVLETGDLAEAQDRLTIAWDASAATGQDLVSLAKLLGKADEDSISQLTRLGLIRGDYLAKTVGGYDEASAAAQVAEKGAMTFEQAMRVVQGGAAGESVMHKLGVATKDMFADAKKGAIDVKGAFNELRGNVKGAHLDRVENPFVVWTNESKAFKDAIGEFVLPIFSSIARFGTRGLKGLRHAFNLFTAGITGPRLGSARKIWKEVFGEEMPEALGVVVDSFGKIATRISTFVEDLNSTDEKSVRGAVKKLFAGVKDDVADGMKKLGEELDRHGAIGAGIKVAATLAGVSTVAGFGADLFGATLGAIANIIQTAYFGVGLGKMLGLATPLGLSITAGVAVGLILSAVAGKDFTNAFKLWADDEGSWKALTGLSAIGVAAGGIALGLSWPVALGVALTVGMASIVFGEDVKANIGTWWTSFQAEWTKKIADFTTWWNTSVKGLPIVGGLLPSIGSLNPGLGEDTGKDRRTGQLPPPGDWVNPPTVPPPPTANQREGRVSGPKATLDDIYAAYERATGGTISHDYAREILAKGFSYQQAAAGNIFMAEGGIVRPRPGGTSAVLGEGGEAEMVLPLSKARGMGFGGRGAGAYFAPGSIVINGDIDSEERLDKLERMLARRIALAGGFAR